MASRGGRGGGRGGRGGASGKPQPPMGHLQYAEIIEQSKQGTDVLYPVRFSSLSRLSDRYRTGKTGTLTSLPPPAFPLAMHHTALLPYSRWTCPRPNTRPNGKRG